MPFTIKIGYRMGIVLGIKNQKGKVSVENFKNRIRLRWRYLGKRYSLSLGPYDKVNLKAANKVVLQIELDMVSDQFDDTLVNYGGKSPKPIVEPTKPKSTVEYFERWVRDYKQMDCDRNGDYFHLRNTLRKWGEINPGEMLGRLNTENYAPKTYNERLSMLTGFSNWMVKQSVWAVNPFEGVSKRAVSKTEKPDRIPFTEDEIHNILDAVKNDRFCPASSRYKHSHYYPFLYFIFKTGVRNAEAVGVRVGSLDFTKNIIVIKESLARSVNGTHAQARVRKATKNGKIRMLPLTEDLREVLLPMVAGKGSDDLVFQSFTGQCIDDRMFQRRVFSLVLKGLNIPHRVLYACRHTFGSRCIDAGITPVMTAFLMGNNPETALRNYTHQISIPKELPRI
jgi:integrase